MQTRRSPWARKNRTTAGATTLGASPQTWPSRRYRSSQKRRVVAAGWGLPLPFMAGRTSQQGSGAWSRRLHGKAVSCQPSVVSRMGMACQQDRPSPGHAKLTTEGRWLTATLLDQDFLRGAHAVAWADGGAQMDEGALQGAQDGDHVRRVHVAHVGDAEDLALEAVLATGDGDAVLRPEGLDDGRGADAGRRRGRRGGGRGALRE